MAEWSKAIVLKSIVFFNTVGSNPTLSYTYLDFGIIKINRYKYINNIHH